MTTIDGYTFHKFSYINAVMFWLSLRSMPGYVSRPPVTSVSATVTVSGTVNP